MLLGRRTNFDRVDAVISSRTNVFEFHLKSRYSFTLKSCGAISV